MSNTIKIILITLFFISGAQLVFSQQIAGPVAAEVLTAKQQQIIQLSKDKWQWMADKDINKLEPLFHSQSKFVHMSGTWKKAQELDIIKTGSIWYKNTDVHDVAAEVIDNTAIVWSRITLTANVRGSDVVTEFTVTEVFKKKGKYWKLLALTFSSVRDTHKIVH
ncbi:MAG: nuclear transport factor 2 family protein [Bacteroidota bacterium]